MMTCEMLRGLVHQPCRVTISTILVSVVAVVCAAYDAFATGGYASGRLDLPFVGHATFGKYPPLTDWDQLSQSDARFAVLGVPNDMGGQYRSGARFGPRGIREASTLFQFGHDVVYDFDTDETYSYGKIVDVGDADIVHTDIFQTHNRTRFAVESILKAGKTPIILGGDHSITTPNCEALATVPNLVLPKTPNDADNDGSDGGIVLIHIDAHLDFVDSRHGVTHGHGNCMRRCAEMPHIAKLIQLGIRGVSSTAKSGFDDARRMGSSILSTRRVRALGAEKVAEMVPPNATVYFSIDVDGLDPSVAHGTGTPSHGGFHYYEVKDLLRQIIYRAERFAGLDFVEVAPAYDPTGTTAGVAARLVLDAIGFANKKSSTGETGGRVEL